MYLQAQLRLILNSLNGGSFCYQYLNLDFDKLEEAHYDVKAKYEVDIMHRADTMDLHLRKYKSFAWIVKITNNIGRAFNAVNYGKLF